MEKAEKVPPALREPVVNHDWFHYIYTYLQVLCIYNWHAPDGWCFSQNIFALDLNVSICPILTCFVVGGRPSYLCQTREAPACCFDFFILKPNVFQDICISYVSFIQHAKWPAKIAWSGLVTLCWFWCSSSAGHFYVFPAESWAQTRSTPFLDGQPTTLTCLAISESLKLVWFHWISELFLWWWQDSLKKKISTRFACSVLWSLVVVMWACLPDANGMQRNVAISESDWKGLVCQLWAACRADGSMLGFTGFSSQACLHCGYFLISSPVFGSVLLTWWIHHC